MANVVGAIQYGPSKRTKKPPAADGHYVDILQIDMAALSGKTTIGAYTVDLAGKVDVWACGPFPTKPAMTSKLEIGDDWARGEAREMINCVRTGRGGYCYAHTPDGRSVGCDLSEFMASYTSESDTYVQFDWDQRLLGAPGERAECTGMQHFPSNPHPYIPIVEAE